MSEVKPDIEKEERIFQGKIERERGRGASGESRAVLKPRQGLIIRNLSSLKKNTAK